MNKLKSIGTKLNQHEFDLYKNSFRIFNNILNVKQQESLIKFIKESKRLKKLPYQTNHFDDVIVNYKEIEMDFNQYDQENQLIRFSEIKGL